MLNQMEQTQAETLIELALEEDAGQGDLTSDLVLEHDCAINFAIIAREEMVLCGIDIIEMILNKYNDYFEIDAILKDGRELIQGAEIVTGKADAKCLMALERTMLNILQHLSGIATLTRKYVKQIDGTKAKILDTRKTIPAYRSLAKYAVRIGGGTNHRKDLASGILIKDNHIAICGSVAKAVKLARDKAPALTMIEVECDNLKQVEQAIKAKADVIMLDNMSLKEIQQAVSIINSKAYIEVSGGVNLNNVRNIAETGVDFISIGKITHSAPAIDIGLDIT